jgi:DNA-binding NarL/FixJ family response regulator
MMIRILLADDHKILRESLGESLSDLEDFQIVGEADDGIIAVREVKELQPDVVIMDISMKNLNGIEASRQILSEFPNIKIIVLSMHLNKLFITEALKVGVSGYLLKNCGIKELEEAIRSVIQGKTYLSPEVSDIVTRIYLKETPEVSSTVAQILTPREREVLQLLAQGKSAKESAEILNVSVKTVEAARFAMRKKLNLNSAAELTQYAIKEGLINIE